MVTLKISPFTNVTLTFDFGFGLDILFMGDMGEGALRPAPRHIGRQTVGRNVT
jgi:hypothetical protein